MQPGKAVLSVHGIPQYPSATLRAAAAVREVPKMRGFKALLCAAIVLTSLAFMPVPAVKAQIVVNIGGGPPSCRYGYYDYAPYRCTPYGYYGPGYFYNGVFIGMGPWSGWGYGHGWGEHRFMNDGGGRYRGGFHGDRGFAHGGNGHMNGGPRGGPGPRNNGPHGGGFHGEAGRGGGASFHGEAAHGGGEVHGGGEAHGGGDHGGGDHGGGDHHH